MKDARSCEEYDLGTIKIWARFEEEGGHAVDISPFLHAMVLQLGDYVRGLVGVKNMEESQIPGKECFIVDVTLKRGAGGAVDQR